MNFSDALIEIKNGGLLTRSGWNGKNMFVFLVQGSEFTVSREPLNTILQPGELVKYRPHIDMRYADGTIGVWLSSMGDLMADDWVIAKGIGHF